MTTRVGTQVGVNAATNVGGGMASRGLAGRNAFDPEAIALDTLVGAGTGAFGTHLATRPPPTPKTVTISNALPEGVLGQTDRFGNITLQPGLSHQDFVETLGHERVHAALRPTQGTVLADQRANVMSALYDKSHLYRYTEEALAEVYATRKLGDALKFPLEQDYGIKPSRMALEGGALAGTAGAGYAGYEVLPEG